MDKSVLSEQEGFSWSSPRGQAFRTAKENPCVTQQWQSENGFKTVYFVTGASEVKIMGTVISKAAPGYWYQRDILDLTRMDKEVTVGFRIYDDEDQ